MSWIKIWRFYVKQTFPWIVKLILPHSYCISRQIPIWCHLLFNQILYNLLKININIAYLWWNVCNFVANSFKSSMIFVCRGIPVATVITFITVLSGHFISYILSLFYIKINHHCTSLDTNIKNLNVINVLTACYSWPLHKWK